MTLVEAVAGTVVLGTILVSILMARVRMEKQSQAAFDRQEACRALQALLETWTFEEGNLPVGQEGDVPHRSGWRWATRLVARDDAAALHADVLAVEVFASNKPGASPAAAIEMLLPRNDDEPTPTTKPGRNAH